MKAMILTGIRAMELREVDNPRIIRDTDVLLRPAVVGVCGSDVHYYKTGRIGSRVVKYPFTVGHECAAIVDKVGEKVSRVRPGDRVAVEPAMSCGQCDQCRSGRPHTCRKLKFLGCPGQAEGCLSEYVLMPQECCYPIPADMTLEQAALSEPLSIGVYSVRLSVPMKGARIGIFGVGPIGLSVLLAAKAQGATKIYVTDKVEARLAVAGRAGAIWTGNPDQGDIVRQISAQEPCGLDAVFECCGQQEAVDQAVTVLKPGGKLLLVGIPTAERISFVIETVRRKEIAIQNVRRQNHCMQTALDMMASGEIKADFMVTHRIPFVQAQAAFDIVEEYRDGVVKAMIEM